MGNCTECHQLRTPGADSGRCLQCHESLRRRIETERGYHGGLAEEDCGTCHKEHLGEDFSLIRMDPDTFPHSRTGYPLEGAHEKAACRTCHTPGLIQSSDVLRELGRTDGLTRTYLGLDQQCRSCHGPDNPHGGQFSGRDCGSCHTEAQWETVPTFDHADTSYPLTGRHQETECSACHVPEQSGVESETIRYVPVEATGCASCHEDPHDGRMEGRCGQCHSTTGWNRVDRFTVESTFDHEVTGFSLVGGHARAECMACHSPSPGANDQLNLRFPTGTVGRSFPRPQHENCISCHIDPHEGVFEGRGCDLCHGPDSWVPPDYDRAQHQMELRFELSGAHAVTPCSACHEVGAGNERRLVFRFEDPGSCTGCHEEDDPHDGAFPTTGCDLCHQTAVFGVAPFDHALLEEAGWDGGCVSCHEADDPHGGQFPGEDCRACHQTDAYAIPDFDHNATGYPLEGAHATVPCGDCHLAVEGPEGQSMIRYRPLDQTCTACHGGRG